MLKQILLNTLIVLILFTSCKTSQKTPQEVVEKLGPDPYFIVDGEPIDKSKLGNYDPSTIATLTTFYGKEAKNKYGEIANDGAVVVRTKKFAINIFEDFFSQYSPEYEEMITTTEREKIQYILNGEILKEDYEGKLSLLEDKTLKGLKVIDSMELKNQFNIDDKEVGVVLKVKE
ncbi:hypothetical protein [Marivirga sp.]|uniref:hypothetical protein n=1 Tax=Marivirga sp. TaxID=2018662 RepID=UPI0025F1AAB0|nr:hypothetical protein [Marivirga sp.]